MSRSRSQADAKTDVNISFKLDSPKTWDTENPYLYTLVTTLYEQNITVDSGHYPIRHTHNIG